MLPPFGRRFPLLNKSHDRFRFANTSYSTLGKASLPLATPSEKPTIFVETDILRVDFPALHELDALDRDSLLVYTVENRLVKRGVALENVSCYFFGEWHVLLLRSKSGHTYCKIDFSTSIMFMSLQFDKLQKQFFNPSAEKLFNL